MANNDRNTLGRLLKLGVVGRNQTYSLTASQMGECGLAPNQLLPLLKATVAEVRDASGQEIEPKTTVALSVSVYNTGVAEILMGVDLIA